MRSALDAWNRHDLEGVLELCAPGIRFRSLIGAVEGSKAHRGHDGMRSWWQEAQDIFADRRLEVGTTITRGDWVVFDGVGVGTGRASQAEVRWPFVGVVRTADGLISEWRLFADPDEAEAFLGDAR